jgi:predicted nucleic acid-binding protein
VRAILDTSVLIGGPSERLDDELAISAISLAELHFGVLIAKTAESRANRLIRLAIVERSFEPLPVDDRVARSYGLLASTVVASGRRSQSRALDLMIAATAHAHQARLYTRNPADLDGLDRLIEIVSVR